MKRLSLLGTIALILALFLQGCPLDDKYWDPNKYDEIVMDNYNNAYDFNLGFISATNVSSNFDGIYNEPWCTDLPVLCGRYEITNVSSFESLTAAPAGEYTKDCREAPLNTVLVFRLNDGSYALVKITDDVFTSTDDSCQHRVTLHVNYPAFTGSNNNSQPVTGTFIDSRDNRVYKTITIGNQTWMAENLAYLPTVVPSSVGSNTEPYYYVHGYQGTNVNAAKSADNYESYGVLYNWTAAMHACPSGWALPTDEEWKQLEMYIGMSLNEADGEKFRGTDEGKKLKSTSGWRDNGNGTDEYGFSGLAGGYRNDEGFKGIGEYGDWWSAPEFDSNTAFYRNLNYNTEKIHRDNFMKYNGFSVRCIKKDDRYGYITDVRDGHTYKTIQIGEQTWMAENLSYLPNVVSPSLGSNIEPYYYVYGYEGTDAIEAKTTQNFQTYGALYNWQASLTACPEGWHLPDDDEWKQLEMYIGMNQNVTDNSGWRGIDEGKKLKATNGWHENGNGTDDYGFSALPGGSRFSSGYFNTAGEYGSWWSATEFGSNSWFRHLRYNYSDVYRYDYIRENGFSVRCIEGDPLGGNTGGEVSFGSITDSRDGQSYKTVKIGNQVWMAENLRATHVNLVTDDNQWSNLLNNGTPAYCWYWNDQAAYGNYGALYNKFAVETGNLCPAGWHVPTYEEWAELFENVGGINTAGKNLKTTNGWKDNGNGTNEYSFSAQPNGFRHYHGLFSFFGETANWWTYSESNNSNSSRYVNISYVIDDAVGYDALNNHGYNVRCVKD
ncbi:MAG: hypothetical protein JXR22_07065 [Prolixibacteraceae bacterium]|nr:hypothetical protein [Prolixibacteraceae bacterium]